MKLKRILLCTIALVMCISLCSCLDLDAAREKHAKVQDDGSIMLNGDKYVLLPECENFSPHFTFSAGEINLTDKDVPLLFSSSLADANTWISSDGIFILCESYFDSVGDFYCREDCYDEVIQAMEDGNKEYLLCFESSTYDHNIADYVINYHFLTEAQADVIEEVLRSISTTKPEYSSDDAGFSYYYQHFDFGVVLEKRTEDLWFTSSDDNTILQLCYSMADDVYYLLLDDTMAYDYRLYPISKEYNDVLDDLMAIHIGAEIEW